MWGLSITYRGLPFLMLLWMLTRCVHELASSARSLNVLPDVPCFAFKPVKVCQRRTTVSTYNGSSSMRSKYDQYVPRPRCSCRFLRKDQVRSHHEPNSRGLHRRLTKQVLEWGAIPAGYLLSFFLKMSFAVERLLARPDRTRQAASMANTPARGVIFSIRRMTKATSVPR